MSGQFHAPAALRGKKTSVEAVWAIEPVVKNNLCPLRESNPGSPALSPDTLLTELSGLKDSNYLGH
jgi:hypothetical protein